MGDIPIRLVGREAELATLDAACSAARAGSGHAVIVEGEAGIGKSHLLAAATESAADAGFATFYGRAEELEVGRPFGAVIDVFDLRSDNSVPGAETLRGLLMPDSPVVGVDAQHLRFQVVDAIVDTVERLSRAGPIALVFDDLQWADPTTLFAIGSVARRVHTLPVLVLGATRPFDATSSLARLVDRLVGDGQSYLALRPLDAKAVAQITQRLVGAPPGLRLLEQVTRAGGNPFFVIQLITSLQEEGEIGIGTDGLAEYRGDALPRQLQATVARRLGRLSDDARQVLRVASVIGPTFSITPVAAALECSVVELIDPVDELVSHGMLADDAGTLTFRHDLIRDAVYEAVPSSTRIGLHRSVGRALAETGAPAVEVAEHFLEAALPGDTLAAEWARRAAADMLAADAGAAVELLERAARLCERQPALAAAIEMDRAWALVWSGRYDEAEALLRGTNRADDEELDRQATTALAHVLYEQARWPDLIAELEPLVADPRHPTLHRDRMRARLAAAYGATFDVDKATTHAEAVLDSQAADGDPIARSEAFMALSWVAEGMVGATTAVDYARRAVAEAERDGTWEGFRRQPHITLATALVRDDQWDEALAAVEEGRRVSDELMSSWDDSMYHAISAMLFFNLGRWDDAEAEVEAGVERCELSGGRVAAPLLYMAQMAISVRRGDLEKAGECLEAARSATNGAPGIGNTQLVRHWGLLLEAQGDEASAFSKLVEAWNLTERSASMFVAYDLLRLAKRQGDESWGPQVVERLKGIASVAGSVMSKALYLQSRGFAYEEPSDLLEAADAFRQSVSLPVLAMTCAEAGRLLADKDPEKARSLLREAESIWEDLGASGALTEIRELLGTIGDADGATSRKSRPVTGWDSLTSSEQKVARLVATGLTNREVGRDLYISPRTVESHLGRVFAKLQIKSRVELAALAPQLENS